MNKAKALDILTATLVAPKMYATTKGELIMRVTTTLEMCLKDFNYQNFYAKHLKHNHSQFFDIHDSFDDEWAKNMINDAIQLL